LNNYVTDAELTQILNNYVTDAELTQLLGGYVTLNQFNTTVAGLNTEIDNLQNQVTTLQTNYTNLQNQYNTLNQALTNLQTQVTNLQNNNQGGQPYILGVSDAATTGRAEFGGKKGYAAATQMCVSTYGAGAHLCTLDEVNFAISTERWDTNRQAAMQNVFTWTAGSYMERANANYDDGLQSNTCQSFNYASGDIATGQRLRLLFNSPTGGNTGQAQANLVEVDRHIGCNTSMKVLCCKYQ
jgi:TolA-binding protein